MKTSVAAAALFLFLSLSSVSAVAQNDGDDRWRCGTFAKSEQSGLTTYQILGKDGVNYPLIGYFDIDGSAVRNLRLALFGLMNLGDVYCMAGPERRVSEREVELKPLKVKRAR